MSKKPTIIVSAALAFVISACSTTSQPPANDNGLLVDSHTKPVDQTGGEIVDLCEKEKNQPLPPGC